MISNYCKRIITNNNNIKKISNSIATINRSYTSYNNQFKLQSQSQSQSSSPFYIYTLSSKSNLININNNHNINNNNISKRFYSSQLDLNTFHDLVDEEIELYFERLEILLEQNSVPGFDVEAGDGVLTINTGSSGTYVLNKQTPNRQIWWSSPLSGPKRFDYNEVTQRWEDNRDKQPMRELLSKEIKQLCKYDMNI